MALFAFGNRGNPVTAIPHRLLFDEWKGRLHALELQAIDVELNRIVSAKRGTELCTVSLLPRALLPNEIALIGRDDWEGSSFLKIWDKACKQDRGHTCWCFALLLWEHMIKRPDAWHFQKHDLDSIPMAATRYFRCTRRDAPDSIRARLVCCYTQPTHFSMGA